MEQEPSESAESSFERLEGGRTHTPRDGSQTPTAQGSCSLHVVPQAY